MTASQENPSPPPDEFDEWKQHPMTQRFLRALFFSRERNKEDWAKGMHKGANPQEWAIRNAEVLGEVAAIERLLSLDMSEIIDMERKANEYIRDQGRWLDGSGKA